MRDWDNLELILCSTRFQQKEDNDEIRPMSVHGMRARTNSSKKKTKQSIDLPSVTA
jgi:hypothetical protein